MSNKTTSKKQKGFTLVEVIVGLSLGISVSIMVASVATLGLKQIRIIENNAKLHSSATFLLNTITYWVKQSNNISVDPISPSNLLITLPDLSKKEIKKDGSSIKIDDAIFNPNDIEVTALNFQAMPHSVQLSFSLKITGSKETFSATTTIAQRNTLYPEL